LARIRAIITNFYLVSPSRQTPRYSLDYALSMSFEEPHTFDISDSHSSAAKDASILVCDAAVCDALKHHSPMSNTDQTLMVTMLLSCEVLIP